MLKTSPTRLQSGCHGDSIIETCRCRNESYKATGLTAHQFSVEESFCWAGVGTHSAGYECVTSIGSWLAYSMSSVQMERARVVLAVLCICFRAVDQTVH